MQTFIPYDCFYKSAESLDQKRLGKQRVECLQLLNSIRASKTNTPYRGWKNHPCRKMWYTGPEFDHSNALVNYGIAVCEVWRARGYKDTCLEKISAHRDKSLHEDIPYWFGREDIHLSHKSKLIQKHPDYYRPQWPDVIDTLEYLWPVE